MGPCVRRDDDEIWKGASKRMASMLTKIAVIVAGLAILITAYITSPGKGLKGIVIAIGIVVAAAVLLTVARNFGP
jgi:hypothetical protein